MANLMETVHFGRKVRAKREAKKWSLSYAAEQCGINGKTLEQTELGDTDPKLSTVVKISKVLDIDIGELNSCKPDSAN